MRLRTKFGLVLLVLTVVLSGVVFGAQEVFKRQAVEGIQENVDETAALTAQQVDASLDDRRNYVGKYASRPELAEFDRTGENIGTFLNNSNFNSALVVAANGTVVDARTYLGNGETLVGRNFSDKRYVQQVLANDGGTYIDEPAYNNATGQWLITLSGAIRGREQPDQIKGVFVASTALTESDDPPTAPIDQDRETAGFFDVVSPLETATGSVAITAVIGGERRYLHEPNRTFEQGVSGRATIDSTRWQVVVTRDRSVVNDRLEGLALVQAISILLVLGGVVSLGIWEYTTNLRQTEDLLAGFSQLRDGQYDHRLSLTTAEEWRKISDGFNDLATDLREREEAIREREQRLEVLNRVLRHNLKNDMSVILSWASLLPEIAEDDQVVDAGDRITNASRRLLDYGEKARQVEETMAKAKEDRVTLDVVPLVEKTMDSLTEEYPTVETTRSCPETASVRAIGGIEYAIENVCENAFEHNDTEEPRVDVRVEQTASTVTITVTDNGPGIPEHELEVIQDGEETALEHGSGVGLWLVYWAVVKSDGDLEFEENDPTGSVVTIELPTSEEAVVASRDSVTEDVLAE